MKYLEIRIHISQLLLTLMLPLNFQLLKFISVGQIHWRTTNIVPYFGIPIVRQYQSLQMTWTYFGTGTLISSQKILA